MDYSGWSMLFGGKSALFLPGHMIRQTIKAPLRSALVNWMLLCVLLCWLPSNEIACQVFCFYATLGQKSIYNHLAINFLAPNRCLPAGAWSDLKQFGEMPW